jgi:hypothetical protein
MSCPVSDVDCDVVVAIEREATIAHNPTIGEREMLENTTTLRVGLGGKAGIGLGSAINHVVHALYLLLRECGTWCARSTNRLTHRAAMLETVVSVGQMEE